MCYGIDNARNKTADHFTNSLRALEVFPPLSVSQGSIISVIIKFSIIPYCFSKGDNIDVF